jgi:hypothetical protein
MKHVHLEQSAREGLGEGYKEGVYAKLTHMRISTLSRAVLTIGSSLNAMTPLSSSKRINMHTFRTPHTIAIRRTKRKSDNVPNERR